MTDQPDPPTTARSTDDPLWRRDFPYESAGEDEVTRREFARYLVLGSGALAAGTLGIAAWTQLRTINTGEPRPIVALDQVAVGDTYLFHYPTANDPAILLRTSDTEVVAFSQKCTHLGCVVFFEADEDRWHCPCHEGNFDADDRRRHLRPADPTARPHRRRGPRRHHLGAREPTVRAPTIRARRTTNAVVIYLIILVSFQVFLVTVAVEAFTTGAKSLAWAAAAVSVALAGCAVLLARFLRR